MIGFVGLISSFAAFGDDDAAPKDSAAAVKDSAVGVTDVACHFKATTSGLKPDEAKKSNQVQSTDTLKSTTGK
jgi:hypothetical protein